MVQASMVPMLLVCCGLAAQGTQPGPAAPAAQAGQPTPAGPAKQLSLREALQTSLQYNLQVDIA